MATSTKDEEDRTSKFAAVLKSPITGVTEPPPVRRRRGIPRWALLGGAAVGILALVGATVNSSLLGPSTSTRKLLTEKVRRADLVVSVAEDGNLESAANKDIRCEVKGGSTILWLIPDGTEVKKGDELVRLDSSPIEDQISQQKIVYEKAKAMMIEAEKNYHAAQIAVQEYIEGTFVQELQTLKANATVAKENLESARNSLQFTNSMHRKGYVTTLQRDAQAFAVQRATLDLDVAETAITVLEKFTKPKMLVTLESTRDSAEAKMASEKAAFELEQDRLERLQTQLEKCVIYAPDNGMVIYANEAQDRRSGSGQGSMVEEGAIMRERQTIIRLPDLSRMQVKSTVHESKVDQLSPGMLARIRIQDRDYQGRISSVANQPEPSNWFSGNVKEYAAIVSVESDPHGLRPGMTAAVEILVANLKNVLSVPVQAVVEKRGKFYCWVNGANGIEKRPVVLGMSNNTRIEVKDGLSDGDDVLLNPRAVVAEAREEERPDDTVDVKSRFGEEKAPAPGAARPGAARPGAAAPGGAAGAQPGAAGGESSKGKAGGGRGLDMKEYDTNSDGKVSLDEAPEMLKQSFEKFDADKDGFLDTGEWGKLRQAVNERMRQYQQQQRGGAPGDPGGP